MTSRNAGLLRRLAAIAYDSLLLLGLLFLVTVPFVAARGGEPVAAGANRAYQLALFATVYAYFVGHWRLSGRTLGMQSWGLRIEAANGGRPTIRSASVRFLSAPLSFLPFGLGFLWLLWDKQRLAWHDRLSGTRIVYYDKPVNPDQDP